MIRIFILISLIAISNATIWDLLPQPNTWKRISQSIPENTLPIYIDNYMALIFELQYAERIGTKPEQIKDSLSSLISSMMSVLGSFHLNKSEFEVRNKKVIYDAISLASQTMVTRMEDSIKPVFSLNSLKRFMCQRIEDLVQGNDRYDDFRFDYDRLLFNIKIWKLRIDTKLASDIYLVPRTLDLVEVRREMLIELVAYWRTGNSSHSDDVIISRIHRIGNSSSSIKTPHVIISLVCVLIMCLI